MAQNSLPEMPAGPVLELYGQRKRFTVPVGLKCLLEEISREVLRMQPTNIYEFIADYLEDKIKKQCREDGGDGQRERRKSWEYKRWSWDGSSSLTNEELLEFLELFHLTFSEASKIAVIIQAAYRGFKGRKFVKEKRASIVEQDNFDLDIEYDGEDTYTVYDCDGNETRFTADDVERILKNYKLSLSDANKYAVKIQKTFRGYRTRESFAKNFPGLASRLEAIDKAVEAQGGEDEDEDAEEMEDANADGIAMKTVYSDDHHYHATTIQKAFRGYRARKAHKNRVTSQGSSAEGNEEYDGEGYGDSEMSILDDDEEGGEDYAGGPMPQERGSGGVDPLMGAKKTSSREGKSALALSEFIGKSEDAEGMKSFGAGPGGELIGDENTGTNQLDPVSVDVRSGQRGQGRAGSGSGSADAPFGYGPDGNPILGPSSVAPFGYGPDGNPLTKLDPRAPNGYGPDGRPLPGTTCSAPFGLGLNGQPLSAPDLKAPFGYHPSDGQPVATNDPTAPFGYGRDGNSLSARDPSAPLGYGLNGQPNLSPETVSFCGDSTASSQMGVPRFLGQGTNTSQGNFGRNGVEAGSQGGCDGNGVMYFAQGGTNVILSYDPARVTDCQPPIRHMANAASSGMEVGCDGGLVDVATVMRQAMEGLLSRVSNMMGGISGQNEGQGCICQCPCQLMNNNNNNSKALPQGSGGGVQRMRSEDATVGTAGTRGFSAGDPMSDPRRFSPGLSPLDLQLPLTGTDYRVQTPPTGTATGTDSGLVTCSNSQLQFQLNGEDCSASAAASRASTTGEADTGTGSGEEPKKKKCSRSHKKKCRPKVKDVSTDVASKNIGPNNGSNSSERDNSSESGPRRRCVPNELRQFVPGTKVGPDGKLPPGAMDMCGGPPPIPPRLGGSAALGELCDAGGSGAFGARTVGKYLQEIAPQYQNLLDTALTPEDKETLTLLTAVGTLLDRIENTGVTRMDPIQLCTDQTLVELTQTGDRMLISLKEHLVKFKSSPQRILEANDSDPLMAQISKEAYDALEIGADSLDVAVGLLKDVIKLCGEMAGHPELLEKCAADIAMARQKNEDQMQDITNKQLTACQQAFQQQNADKEAATATTGAGTDSSLDGQMDGTQTDGVSSVEEGSDAMSVTARALGNRGLSSSLPGSTTNAAALARTGNDGINDGVAGSGAGSGSNVDFGDGSGAGAGSGYGAISDADAVAGRGLGSDGEASTNAYGGTDDNPKSDVLDMSRLMGENLSSVTNLLNGAAGNSRTRRMMFITVSFLLGAAIGYAIARSYGIVGPHSRMSELLWGSARCPTGISKLPAIPLGGGCNRCVVRTPNGPQ